MSYGITSYLEFLLKSALVSVKLLVEVNPIILPSFNISYPSRSALTLLSILNVNLFPFSISFNETSKLVSLINPFPSYLALRLFKYHIFYLILDTYLLLL